MEKQLFLYGDLMNRYLFVLGTFSAVAGALLYIFGVGSLWLLAVFSVTVLAVSIILRKRLCEAKSLAVLSAVSLLLLMYFAMFYNLGIAPIIKLGGKNGVVEGYVCEEPTKSGGMNEFDIKVTSFSEKSARQNFKIRIKTFDGARVDVFDKVKARVSFRPVKNQYKRSMFSDGIYVDTSAITFEKGTSRVQKPFYSFAIGLRRNMRSIINASFDKEDAGFLCALAVGDRSQLDRQLNKDLVNCGVAHVIAISGMHISIVCMTFMNLMIKITKRLRLSALLTIPLVVFFVALTGFTPSAVRAGIMFIIMAVGVLIFRKEDPINSLGGAVLLMLLINPFFVCDLSFLLSVISVFGILVFANKIQNAFMKPFKNAFLRRVLYYPSAAVSMTVSATLATLPITAIWLGYVSNIAIVANVLVIFAVNCALITCLVGLALSSLGPMRLAAGLVFAITRFMINYISFVVRGLSKIPFARSCIGFRYFLVWLAAALLLIGLCLIIFKEKLRIRLVSLLCVLLLLVSAVAWNVVDRNVVELAVIGDGNGFSCVVRKNRRCVLIGCLSEYDERAFISNYLLSRGIDSPDALIMPTSLDNVAGGLKSVVDFYGCDTIIAPVKSLNDDVKRVCEGLELRELENTSMKLYGGITLRTINNSYGCALILEYGNKVCFISACSGDYERYRYEIGTVDLVVTPAVVTTGLLIKTSTNVVLAGDAKRGSEIVRDLNLQSNKVVLTDGNRVVARFKETSDIKIIRE